MAKIWKFVRGFVLCIRESIADLMHHDGVEHAGYLSFLTMLGIFPFVVFLVTILGIINRTFFNNELYNVLDVILPESSWSELLTSLKPRLIEIINTPPHQFLTFAIVSAIWSASSILEGLRTILNRAYRVSEAPSYVLGRLLSILKFMVLISCVSALVIVITIIPAIFSIFEYYMSGIAVFEYVGHIPIVEWVNDTKVIRGMFALLIEFAFILYLHLYLPNRKQRVLYVLPGICLTILGWGICSAALRYYIAEFSQISLIYGSIGGIVVSLFYFYMCSIVFIFSAEFNTNLYLMMKNFRTLKGEKKV
jgi:membrane protein